MHTRLWRVGALVVALAIGLCAQDANATVVEGLTLEQMAARSPVIVRATVGSQESRWDEGHRRIQTFTELLVTEVLKGDVPKSLIVRAPGGVVGNLGADVAGAPRFKSGDDVVLFLEHPGDDPHGFVVTGLSAGKITLEKTALGEVRARRDLRGIAFLTPGSSDRAPKVRDLNNVEDLGTADAFLQRIRTAVAHAQAKTGGR